jgi:hypothetical protein
LVGGGGVVRGNSLQRIANGAFGSNVFGPFGDETSLTHTAPGVTVGTDLAIEAAPSIRIVPQFRMLMIARGDAQDVANPFSDLGLPKVVYRLGIAIRAAF